MLEKQLLEKSKKYTETGWQWRGGVKLSSNNLINLVKFKNVKLLIHKKHKFIIQLMLFIYFCNIYLYVYL